MTLTHHATGRPYICKGYRRPRIAELYYDREADAVRFATHRIGRKCIILSERKGRR